MPVDAASFLKEVFATRARVNTRYSLRAFARTLGLSPGGLSQILNRKKKLSLDRAHEIVHRLGLNESQAERFLTLVELNGTSSLLRKMELIRRLESSGDAAANLAVDHFQLISTWYGLPLLVLISDTPGPLTLQDLAQSLGLARAEVEVMLERLIRLELVEIKKLKNGSFMAQRLKETVLVNSPFAHEAITKYYREIHGKTLTSLTEQTPETRVSGAQTFVLERKQISRVRELTHRYLDDLEALSARGKKNVEVYQAITHVYQLTDKGSKK